MFSIRSKYTLIASNNREFDGEVVSDENETAQAFMVELLEQGLDKGKFKPVTRVVHRGSCRETLGYVATWLSQIRGYNSQRIHLKFVVWGDNFPTQQIFSNSNLLGRFSDLYGSKNNWYPILAFEEFTSTNSRKESFLTVTGLMDNGMSGASMETVSNLFYVLRDTYLVNALLLCDPEKAFISKWHHQLAEAMLTRFLQPKYHSEHKYNLGEALYQAFYTWGANAGIPRSFPSSNGAASYISYFLSNANDVDGLLRGFFRDIPSAIDCAMKAPEYKLMFKTASELYVDREKANLAKKAKLAEAEPVADAPKVRRRKTADPITAVE